MKPYQVYRTTRDYGNEVRCYYGTGFNIHLTWIEKAGNRTLVSKLNSTALVPLSLILWSCKLSMITSSVGTNTKKSLYVCIVIVTLCIYNLNVDLCCILLALKLDQLTWISFDQSTLCPLYWPFHRHEDIYYIPIKF